MAAGDDDRMAETWMRLLGRFQVRRDGEEVPPASFGGRKVRTLLRLLAVRAPDLVPHDVLAEALWPDRLPADPPGNLGVLVNRARRAVGDPGLVVTGAGGYALGPCRVDVAEFLDLLARARSGGAPGATLRAAEAALRLWGDPLPEDTYAPWAREPRERLLRAWVDALETAATAELSLGAPRSAAARAAVAANAEPLRESATVTLARALAAAGDPAGALARLGEFRTRLVDELGVDPSAEFERLQLAVLRGEPPVAPIVPARPAAPAAAVGFAGLEFVGRDGELRTLRDTVDAGGIVAVSGVPGVGKSRLVAEALSGCPRPVIAARAFLPERAEAWALAGSLLREACGQDAAAASTLPRLVRAAVAGLLPELDEDAAVSDGAVSGGVVSGTAAPDGESRRALLLAGGVRLLREVTGSGAVLVVDDLQWADASSLALLGSTLARVPGLAAVLAYRTGDLAEGVLTGLVGSRVFTEIDVRPLAATEVAGLTSDAALAEALVEGTDRTPFAISEVLRELVARGEALPGPGGWRPRNPGTAPLAAQLGREGQRRGVERRARRQTGQRSEVLALLSLLAREVPARIVAAAAGLNSRTTLDLLTALAADGLVRLGEQGWAPAHDVVGEAVTRGLAPADRGRLHGLLAAALEAESAGGGAEPSEVARHHREAGDTAAAAVAYERAARRVLHAHAAREAAELAAAGLALQPGGAVGAALLEIRAEARAIHGELDAAVSDLRSALAFGGHGRSRRLTRLAMLTSGSRDPHRAAELAELALVEAGADDLERATALETAAILDMNLGRPERARQRAEEALQLYRAAGDAGGVARILDGRAMATFLDGRVAEGVELFGRVAELFEDAGELLRVVTPRSTAGHGLVFLDRPGDGLAATGDALRLARELDAPEAQSYALWHRSEALSGLDRTEEAEADAREALSIARAVAHRGWTATGYRALGIALQAQGRLDEAAAAFTASAGAAGDSLGLFACWAAARSAMVAVAVGEPDRAAESVGRALALGPPLGHYEARLAQVELAAARGADELPVLAAAALATARAGGHVVSARMLERYT
jgi:DNA-binding SARP family transcriptional activator/tetratricopeptide (TPR) repeat protein